jgi:hypothetical protein
VRLTFFRSGHHPNHWQANLPISLNFLRLTEGHQEEIQKIFRRKLSVGRDLRVGGTLYISSRGAAAGDQ